MNHPVSIFLWQPPYKSVDTGEWIEPVQVFAEEYAIYIANLIHKECRAVIKVVLDGKTIAAFPDKRTVEQAEEQSAKKPEEQEGHGDPHKR